jgi:arylsulfatase A-like enzyme
MPKTGPEVVNRLLSLLIVSATIRSMSCCSPLLLLLSLSACQNANDGGPGPAPDIETSTEPPTAVADTQDTGGDSGDTEPQDTAGDDDTAGDTVVDQTLPPNLLLVLLDDVGTDKISSYAGDYATHGYEPQHLPATPVIDRLAESGVRFTHAWANPQCSPTRAAMHTGEHGFRTRVGAPIPPSPELDVHTPTIAEILGPTHRSAVFGKWHLGSTGAVDDEQRTIDFANAAKGYTVDSPGTWNHTANPLLHGFERFSGGLGSGICVQTGTGGCEGTYTDWIQVYADVSEFKKGDSGNVQLTMAWEETQFATEEVVSRTLDWIGEVGDDSPWFASVNFHAAHTPHVDQTPYGCTTSSYDPDDLLNDPAMYQSMVECMDTWLGALLVGIDGLGELDGTLIVVVGDNGTPDFAAEAPFAATGRGKATTYESGVRVPFVVADGGSFRQADGDVIAQAPLIIGSPGRSESRPVHTTDLYATLAQIAGIDVGSTGQDSFSFLDVLQDPRAEPPVRFLYSETFQEKQGLMQGAAALRDNDGMKLLIKVLPLSGQPGDLCMGLQLYDVMVDPLESLNLIGDPAFSGAQQDLEDALAALVLDGADWLDVDETCP